MGSTARHVIDRQLPDYASQDAKIRRTVKVGIKGVEMYRHDFSDRSVLTRQSAYIKLEQEQGAHMSRLIEALYARENGSIMLDNVMLENIADSHDVNNAYWECQWRTIFDSDKPFAFDVALEGAVSAPCADEDQIELPNLDYKWFLTVTVPYASVCPCSNEMVKEVHRGVPHMQRSTVKVTGMIRGDDDLDYLIPAEVAKIADVVKLLPEPMMKRPDELSWCKRAQKVNLFVEDAARRVSEAIDGFYNDFVVVAEHQESIHQHNVVAICHKGDVLL